MTKTQAMRIHAFGTPDVVQTDEIEFSVQTHPKCW